MEKNIFEGAKFGDKFVTRDGSIAIYLRRDGNIYELSTEICGIYSRLDGTNELTKIGFESDYDIVSRYQEPIDEDKLDELAKEYEREITDKVGYIEYSLDSFKAGYRKAMEE